MKRKRDILLCDLDAFFASVEQLDNPALRGKPILVGGSPDKRGVVSTCSYEARVYGVRSAMPMKKAITLCPEAIIIKGRMSRYKEISGEVRAIFKRFTPDIEFLSIDEAYLAVRESLGISVGNAIHAAVREELGLPISVGISSNKLLAKIACERAKPNSVGTLWITDVEEMLWPLPIRTLPGVGQVTEMKLRQLGIKTVRELADYPVESLVRMLGNNAGVLHNYAHGIDNRKLEPEHETKSISEETTFPEDIYDRETILIILMELSAGVGYRVRSAGFTARTITLKLRYKDFKTITRSKTLPEAVCSDAEIYRLARDLFANHCGAPPWRLAGVQASGFEWGTQRSLLQPTAAELKEKELTVTRDRLREKYGSEVIFQGKRLSMKEKDNS